MTYFTDRLIIREHNKADAEFIYKLMNQESWIKYIGDRNIDSIAAAKQYLADRHFKAYRKYGYGMFAICNKQSNEVMGSVGLVNREGLDVPDIGFALLSKFEGNGYVYEAALEILELAKLKFLINKLSAITTLDNIKSIKLLHKLGFVNIKTIQLPNEPVELNYFELTL
jgi:RimJ/RimL family protein N-acetyltransferase